MKKYKFHIRTCLGLFCLRVFKVKKIAPLSISPLPRGSSNSFLWLFLLNFPLYNLLNSRIPMVTTAHCWYSSNIPYIFAGEPWMRIRCRAGRSRSPNCPNACGHGRAVAELEPSLCFRHRCHTAISHGLQYLAPAIGLHRGSPWLHACLGTSSSISC